MKNILNTVNDTFSKYTLDKVDCFERQIANVLEIRRAVQGHVYILIKKIYLTTNMLKKIILFLKKKYYLITPDIL